MKQLAADCSLMEELRVMDYSLLLGVHYRSPGYASSPQVTDKVHCSIPCHLWAPLHADARLWLLPASIACLHMMLACLLVTVYAHVITPVTDVSIVVLTHYPNFAFSLADLAIGCDC